jgi:DNA repair photolyase
MMVRLNGPIGGIFEDWIARNYPERAGKVLSIIRETHGGELSDSRFRLRMRGEGEYAEQINRAFKLACRKNGLNSGAPQQASVSCDLFQRPEKGQLSLF